MSVAFQEALQNNGLMYHRPLTQTFLLIGMQIRNDTNACRSVVPANSQMFQNMTKKENTRLKQGI